jgi:hypothetical protein
MSYNSKVISFYVTIHMYPNTKLVISRCSSRNINFDKSKRDTRQDIFLKGIFC